MPAGNSYPGPILPLTGAEQLTLFQQQAGQVVTTTASVSDFLSGIGGQTLVTPNLGTVPRTLSALTGDAYNLKNLGALLDGSAGDSASIQAAYNAVPDGSTINVPANAVWPNDFVVTPTNFKSVYWNFLGQADSGVNYNVGDGDLVSYFQNGTLQYYRQYLQNEEQRVMMSLNVQNSLETTAYGDGFNCLVLNYASSETSVNEGGAFSVNSQTHGMNGFGNFDVGQFNYVFKYGNNWNWVAVFQMTDVSGLPSTGNTYTLEIDFFCNGYDTAQAYSTGGNGRAMIACHAIQVSAPLWEADTIYEQYYGIDGVNGANYSIYKSTTAGTSGSVQPTWPLPTEYNISSISWNNGIVTVQTSTPYGTGLTAGQQFYITITGCTPSGYNVTYAGYNFLATVVSNTTFTYPSPTNPGAATVLGQVSIAIVVDGTVLWSWGTQQYAEVGTGVSVYSDYEHSAVGVAFGVGGNIFNACLDTTTATLSTNAAAIRLAPDQVIDFASLNTQATQNTRTLFYSPQASSFVYQANQVSLLAVNDAGICFFGGMANTVSAATPLTSGGTFAIPNGVAGAYLYNQSLYADYTFVMPTSPAAGQRCVIGSQYGITSCSFTETTGTLPSVAIAAGGSVEFFYEAPYWYRLR